jgi:sulfur-carrier protein adenylyltransferase/sulfurtransferase
MFEITSERIDADALRLGVMDRGCGGYTAFEGWVRDHHQGRAVSGLHYEAYADLARAEGLKILAEAEEQFGPVRLACAHRVGDLAVGELAVWVGAAAPHRDEAFKACRYVIDELKQRLPIWKKEHYIEGQSAWVDCERCRAAGHGKHDHDHHDDHAAGHAHPHKAEETAN